MQKKNGIFVNNLNKAIGAVTTLAYSGNTV